MDKVEILLENLLRLQLDENYEDDEAIPDTVVEIILRNLKQLSDSILNENFDNRNSLEQHYKKHVLQPNTKSMSNHNNIKYDSMSIRAYKELAYELRNNILPVDLDYYIDNLNAPMSQFKAQEFLYGDSNILVVCPDHTALNNKFRVEDTYIFHKYSEHCNNYSEEAIDMLILDKDMNIKTLYPISIDYFTRLFYNYITNED